MEMKHKVACVAQYEWPETDGNHGFDWKNTHGAWRKYSCWYFLFFFFWSSLFAIEWVTMAKGEKMALLENKWGLDCYLALPSPCLSICCIQCLNYSGWLCVCTWQVLDTTCSAPAVGREGTLLFILPLPSNAWWVEKGNLVHFEVIQPGQC